jgi:KUP system potassium uptake protein
VFPALTLNYLAQGSLILRSPKAVANPFFLLLPTWAQVPMVLLATVATAIASQSVISGAFSVTRQAVQLGFLPRVKFRQTSEHEIGQIYAPAVNRGLFVAVVVLVVGFGSSVALASAPTGSRSPARSFSTRSCSSRSHGCCGTGPSG